MKKIAVFDLDGTLVNTIEDLGGSVNRALARFGLDPQPIESYKLFVGSGRDVMVRLAMAKHGGDDALFGKVNSAFDAEYAAHCCDKSHAYDGCAELLSALSDSGIKTAVLSNKPDEFVDVILKKAFPTHKFSAAWGKKPQYPKKPDPASLLSMLSECGFTAADCVFIGDSVVDVLTAANAGVSFAGVEWGFRGRAELEAEGAEFISSTAAELRDYILEKL